MNRKYRKTLIAGNWKMNKTPTQTKAFMTELKGLLPKEYVVAHKTGTGGTLPDGAVSAINDAGIIVLPGGRRMAVTVFVMNSKDSPAVCEGTIASVARWLCTEWKAAGGVKK